MTVKTKKKVKKLATVAAIDLTNLIQKPVFWTALVGVCTGIAALLEPNSRVRFWLLVASVVLGNLGSVLRTPPPVYLDEDQTDQAQGEGAGEMVTDPTPDIENEG